MTLKYKPSNNPDDNVKDNDKMIIMRNEDRQRKRKQTKTE